MANGAPAPSGEESSSHEREPSNSSTPRPATDDEGSESEQSVSFEDHLDSRRTAKEIFELLQSRLPKRRTARLSVPERWPDLEQAEVLEPFFNVALAEHHHRKLQQVEAAIQLGAERPVTARTMQLAQYCAKSQALSDQEGDFDTMLKILARWPWTMRTDFEAGDLKTPYVQLLLTVDSCCSILGDRQLNCSATHQQIGRVASLLSPFESDLQQ